MRSVCLTPEIRTSHLGFGTATLAQFDSHRAISKVLGKALDAGITHFDTARSYGHGTMEGLVGTFLQGKRSQVTIATKFGFNPPLHSGALAPLLHRIEGLVKRVGFLRNRARAFAEKATTRRYDVESARKSLERSLRELRTDCVDLFLVHEGSVADATDESLLGFLEAEKAAGRIRSFGLAANFATTAAMPDTALQRYDVVQIPNNVLSANVEKIFGRVRGTIITHSVFSPLPIIAGRLAQSESLRRRWEGHLGIDLQDPWASLPRLLLQAAISANMHGVTLFSATNGAHVRANAAASEGHPSEEKRRLLQELALELAP